MSDVIFQSSDLVNQRTRVLDAARAGGARLRDKDGTSLVMLPESRLQLLEALADWNSACIRLEELLRRGTKPSVGDLGRLAWLRVFDNDELREFLDELEQELVVAHSDGEIGGLQDCITAWRATARQLEDPLRRSVLRSDLAPGDLVSAPSPDDD